MKISTRVVLTIIIVSLVFCLFSPALLKLILQRTPNFLPNIDHGPFSYEQALGIESYSGLYRPDPKAGGRYNKFDLTFYHYTVDSADLEIDTYFTVENSQGEVVRVAKLAHYDNRHDKRTPDFDLEEQEVAIQWADQGTGHVCKLSPDAITYDQIVGEPYQSCLYWSSEGLDFLLLTVWTKQETIDFVNVLIKAK